MFELTNRILRERKRHGVLTAIICGRFGVGKSMYCIKAGHELYLKLGYADDDAWALALDAVVFEPREFGEKLDSIKDVAEIIIMDDASVHVGSDLYKTANRLYVAYKQALTTIRTKTGCLLYNCPEPEGLAKFIRNSQAYQIYVTVEGGCQRCSTAYQYKRRNTKIGLQRRQYKVWKDFFSVTIPSRYYKQYLEKREGYLDKPIKELLKGDALDDKEA